MNKLDDKELSTLMKYYPNIKHDYAHVAKYFSKDALAALQAKNPAWKAVDEDIEAVERLFDIKAGPQTPEQEKHAQLAADLVKISDKETKTTLISRQAILRKFLG